MVPFFGYPSWPLFFTEFILFPHLAAPRSVSDFDLCLRVAASVQCGCHMAVFGLYRGALTGRLQPCMRVCAQAEQIVGFCNSGMLRSVMCAFFGLRAHLCLHKVMVLTD